MLPTPYDRRISVDADAHARRFFVPKDRTTAQVGFNIGGVRRKDVDDVLVALSLPARISHVSIIVRFADNVKGCQPSRRRRAF
jgi:hypothetical protein